MAEQKEKNEIRIYNNLPESKSMNFNFHLTYPNISLYVVEGLPTQQELDCGYWSLFYSFIVFLTPESMDMISKLKESLNDKFETYKSFVKDYLKIAHNKIEEKVRKYRYKFILTIIGNKTNNFSIIRKVNLLHY